MHTYTHTPPSTSPPLHPHISSAASALLRRTNDVHYFHEDAPPQRRFLQLFLRPARVTVETAAVTAAAVAGYEDRTRTAAVHWGGGRLSKGSCGGPLKERFTVQEMSALVSGIKEFGLKWALIKKNRKELQNKNQGNLKDKWWARSKTAVAPAWACWR
ncbi:hypothetical protein Vretimale_18149 [Volvox reticuliferus]|uniref:Uncharacterized protein n=1 Tax=Volvox reticuliferus TaxID=1737510 RepID=A0A8J4GX95_9CHLO|nr:hypothetical protein Vretifemale_17786 [Volvox reticuliferus]GIM15290.1 hypothetical protein Vretimale_18149 [Volvox reticuliferus]